MKIGDLVRRSDKYTPEYRQDIAIVVEIGGLIGGQKTGAAKVIWANLPDYHTWLPESQLEILNESR